MVNAGIRHGRDAEIEDAQATVDVGVTMTMSDVMATRGERLALIASSRFGPMTPRRFDTDALDIVEIDADERIVAVVVFDLDDFDAAIANSMPDTSPAKRPPTRTRGRSSRGAYAALNRRETARDDTGLW